VEDFNWLVSLGVVAIPAIISAIVAFFNREARTPRPIRNIGQLAEAASKLQKGSRAAEELDLLIADYAKSVSPDLTTVRKLNRWNVAGSIVLLAVTVFAMYWLSTWITVSSNTGWNVLAWVVTGLAGFFFFMLNIAAISSFYNPPTSDAERAQRKTAKAARKAAGTANPRS
jgi:hypothetical protein